MLQPVQEENTIEKETTIDEVVKQRLVDTLNPDKINKELKEIFDLDRDTKTFENLFQSLFKKNNRTM